MTNASSSTFTGTEHVSGEISPVFKCSTCMHSYCTSAYGFFEYFTQIPPKFLACLRICVTDYILFCHVVREVGFLCWINYVTPSFAHCLLFMLMTWCLFLVFAPAYGASEHLPACYCISPHLHFNAHWCKPSSVALALPSTVEAGLQCERSSKCRLWSLPFHTNSFLFFACVRM